MIIKSSQRAQHKELADHLTKRVDIDGETQRVAISNARYIWPQDNVHRALADMEIMSWQSARVQKDLYHVSISPSAELDDDQWQRAFDIYEEEFGLQELAYIEVAHDKKGRVHRHRVYERVDADTGKAIALPYTKIRNELVARQLEYVFGQPLTVGKHNRTVMLKLAEQGKHEIVAWMEQEQAHAVERPVAELDYQEVQQERRTNIAKQDIRESLQEAYLSTDSGLGFEAVIAERGLLLCKGTRRDFVILDANGGTHSPRRMLAPLGVKTKDLRERWQDLNPDHLLTVQDAKDARAVQEAAALRQSMTSAEQLAERQLSDEIVALQRQLYAELQEESLGAETHAGTYRLLDGEVVVKANASATASDSTDAEAASTGYQDFVRWQERFADTQQDGLKGAEDRQDQRRLIEELQHWQTIAESEPERPWPQVVPTTGMEETDSLSTLSDTNLSDAELSLNPVQEANAWGLAPSIALLIQTYTGQQAVAERERRLDAALAADGITTAHRASNANDAREERSDRQDSEAMDMRSASPKDRSGATDLASPQQNASRTYLQELGQYLREKGRGAYTQADRWLAEKLARRGYSRQETRRVIARSSPELMEQAPGQRVGYIQRIVERVYIRREQWQARLTKKQSAEIGDNASKKRSVTSPAKLLESQRKALKRSRNEESISASRPTKESISGKTPPEDKSPDRAKER